MYGQSSASVSDLATGPPSPAPDAGRRIGMGNGKLRKAGATRDYQQMVTGLTKFRWSSGDRYSLADIRRTCYRH
jgi:hypothetical protein